MADTTDEYLQRVIDSIRQRNRSKISVSRNYGILLSMVLFFRISFAVYSASSFFNRVN